MRHLDLFSGIGGFAYAIDQVWDNVEHLFCDNNLFCQKVLAKHWPESKIYEDIRTFTDSISNEYRPITRKIPKESSLPKVSGEKMVTRRIGGAVSLLTGGFPCQPFSQAGKRKGKDDDRYLWPEMLRIIREFKPTWVIAENVRGLLTIEGGLVFEQVCLDLEAEGYEVQPFIIPAVAVNAPHRRDRVWIIANLASKRLEGSDRTPIEGYAQSDSHAKDSRSERSGGRLEGDGQVLERQSTKVKDEGSSWETNWIEVATELCGLDDGLPAKLGEFELSKSRHRTEQLKAYGNAIVPQVAVKIMEAIKYATS